jgi:hypothetical protein
MSGQIVDATIVATPKQRNTLEEKKAIKEGQIPADWKDKPAKLAQKDLDARWTVKYSKAKPREDGSVPAVDLAIPAFGYKNVWPAPSARGIVSDPYQLQQRIRSRASARPRWRAARHDPHNHVGLNGHLVAQVFATPFRCWAIYRNHPQNSSVDCAWGAQPFNHGSGQVRHGDESPIRAQHRPSDPRQFIGERNDDGIVVGALEQAL